MCSLVFVLLIVMLAIILGFHKAAGPGLKRGDLAPGFSLRDEHGTMRSLSEFRGKKVALYFYPKDETPGCTRQACSIRDHYESLRDHEIEVLGISFDDAESHASFKQNHNLTYPLLSDADKEVAVSYGVYQRWFALPFAKRRTFLIDEQGRIAAIIKNVNVTSHAQQILQGFKTIL